MGEKRFYAVYVKGGHVGRNYYITKTIPVVATSRKEAAEIARNIPRVKHDHGDAIKEVVEITNEVFDNLIIENNQDPYFTSTSIQQYRLLCEDYKEYIESEDDKEIEYDEFLRKQRISFKLKKRALLEG